MTRSLAWLTHALAKSDRQLLDSSCCFEHAFRSWNPLVIHSPTFTAAFSINAFSTNAFRRLLVAYRPDEAKSCALDAFTGSFACPGFDLPFKVIFR